MTAAPVRNQAAREAFIMGLVGLPWILGWIGGRPAGEFIQTGLSDPETAGS